VATRVDKAFLMPVQRVPQFFKHAVTLGKPSAPSTSSLGPEDLQRFQLWAVQAENGSLTGNEAVNASPALVAAMAAFSDYLGSPTYHNWAMVDMASREYQYRLFIVDVAEALGAKSTNPPSNSPSGAPSNPISVGDVGTLGGDETTTPPDYVSSGGTQSELVYGDDQDLVTVN